MPASAPLDHVLLERLSPALRAAGWLSIGAGVTFLLTVTYLFTVLPATGWSIAMFDAPADLLAWINGREQIYQTLWLLYFSSQMCLLAVPTLLSDLGGRTAAVFGTTAVVLAMVGLALLFAVSPVLARAYGDAAEAGAVQSVTHLLVLHDVMADAGKDLRLFSELLLGIWLACTGHLLRRQSHHRRWWALTGLGGWTLVVAAIKLFDPTNPLEDWLGFLLGTGYLVLGAGLLRRGSTSRTYPGTTTIRGSAPATMT